ncbi:MAG TPA: CdaR family protein [Blastocatellia bacterium]|nr:CdaR family protein [Blastocatellia bacterium]
MDRMNHYLRMIKGYARDYVLENTDLKVLALLITGVLWLSVAARPESTITLHNLPVDFRNLPASPDLAVSKYDTLTARAVVRGPRDVLDSLRAGELTAVADLAGVEPGVRVIQLRLDPVPPSVEVREVVPRSIRVTVERVVRREVTVRPRFDGNPPAGYEVAGWRITPPTASISGAESLVRDIGEVSTETVGLADKTATFSLQVAIDIGTPNVNVEDRTVQLTVNISEIKKERVFDRIPVELLGAPANSLVTPAFLRVTVHGAASAIDAMMPSDIQAALDFEESRGRSRRMTPRVTVSPAFADRVTVRAFGPPTVVVR